MWGHLEKPHLRHLFPHGVRNVNHGQQNIVLGPVGQEQGCSLAVLQPQLLGACNKVHAANEPLSGQHQTVVEGLTLRSAANSMISMGRLELVSQ